MPHVHSTLPLLTMATEARLACGTYLRVHYHWSVLVEGGDLRIKVKRTIWMQWIMAYGQRAVSLFRRTSRRHACAECHACLSRSFVRKSTVGSILSANRVLLRRRLGLRSCACVQIAALLSCLRRSHTHYISGHARDVSRDTFLSLVLVDEFCSLTRCCLMGARMLACLPAYFLLFCTCGNQLCPLSGFLFP